MITCLSVAGLIHTSCHPCPLGRNATQQPAGFAAPPAHSQPLRNRSRMFDSFRNELERWRFAQRMQQGVAFVILHGGEAPAVDDEGMDAGQAASGPGHTCRQRARVRVRRRAGRRGGTALCTPPTDLLGQSTGADHDTSRHRDCMLDIPQSRLDPRSPGPLTGDVHHAGARQRREPRGGATCRRPRRRDDHEAVRSAWLQPGEVSQLLCELLKLCQGLTHPATHPRLNHYESQISPQYEYLSPCGPPRALGSQDGAPGLRLGE